MAQGPINFSVVLSLGATCIVEIKLMIGLASFNLISKFVKDGAISVLHIMELQGHECKL
jgi:hypothetical protein